MLRSPSTVLYSYRNALSVALFLTAVYFALYTQASVPSLVLFLGWQPDTKLMVLANIPEEYRRSLQSGDTVLAIDDRPVLRGQTTFLPPVQPSYKFTLQRGERIFVQEITVNESQLFQIWVLSLNILALAFWFIGFMTVRFARPQQSPPLYVGFGFQLVGVGIISPSPSQLGAPGAWIIGNVLIFYFPLIMLYLSFIPRHTPLNRFAKRLLQGSFYLLTSMALVAAIEVVFLFPDQSLKEIIGIGSGTFLTILTGVSVVATVVILFIRLSRSPRSSYERQQLSILWVFLVLAVVPLFFFVILPLDKFLFVPFPFVYSLFLLAPSGYFFVLHRHGHLELDALFSRIVTIVSLTMAVGMAYATGVYLLDTVFQIKFDNFGQGAFILVLFGMSVSSQRQVQKWVDLLFYGRDTLDQDSFQVVKTRLSANPEPATVADVVQRVALHLNVKQVGVLVKDSRIYRLLAGNVSSFTINDSDGYRATCLRTRDPGGLIGLPEWVEISLPITARGDMLGLLVLSRPLNGYFNARQVQMLQDIADILAFGLLVISLVDTMQDLSQKALIEKEHQRQQIATEIHNVPLQTLATVMMQLQRNTSDKTMQNAAETIRQVTQDLRRIISGLRPPVLRESIEWMTRQMIREFMETHDDIRVVLNPLEVRSDRQADELTKLSFYYILTEALNNINKHARATLVDVSLYYDEAVLTLVVKDNGVGTDVVAQPVTELLRRHHIGVADMYRWASMARGTLEIEANTPTGTVIRLILPTTLESG